MGTFEALPSVLIIQVSLFSSILIACFIVQVLLSLCLNSHLAGTEVLIAVFFYMYVGTTDVQTSQLIIATIILVYSDYGT